jgi:hypothetical protein
VAVPPARPMKRPSSPMITSDRALARSTLPGAEVRGAGPSTARSLVRLFERGNPRRTPSVRTGRGSRASRRRSHDRGPRTARWRIHGTATSPGCTHIRHRSRDHAALLPGAPSAEADRQ